MNDRRESTVRFRVIIFSFDEAVNTKGRILLKFFIVNLSRVTPTRLLQLTPVITYEIVIEILQK